MAEGWDGPVGPPESLDHTVSLTTHPSSIRGVDVHPLNKGGGLSEAICFIVFFEAHPLA